MCDEAAALIHPLSHNAVKSAFLRNSKTWYRKIFFLNYDVFSCYLQNYC